MVTILVTGGAGYMGYSLIEELGRRYPDSRIIIYDNFSKGRVEGLVSLREKVEVEVVPWEKGDIRDGDNFRQVVEKYRPEIVIHLAAIVDAFTTNREGKDRECEIVNYEGAVNVARIAKENGVRDFIGISTVSIYSRGEELTEEAEKEPLSAYGKAKLKAETEILQMSDDNFRVVVLRPATLVGYNPCFRYETIINLMCIRSVYKIPINLFASAITGNKTYLHVNDCARAIVFSLENIEKMKQDYFNMSSFHTNLDVVMRLLKELVGEEFPYYIIDEKKINQQVYTINSDKIKGLGFRPEESIEGTIEFAVRGLKRRREMFKEI
jgi:UDP-glucose 4-epimerase